MRASAGFMARPKSLAISERTSSGLTLPDCVMTISIVSWSSPSSMWKATGFFMYCFVSMSRVFFGVTRCQTASSALL